MKKTLLTLGIAAGLLASCESKDTPDIALEVQPDITLFDGNNSAFLSKKELMYGSRNAIRYFCTAEASHIPLELFIIAMEYKGKVILTKATAFWMNPSKKTKDFTQLMNKVEPILNSIKVE